jgi:tRNA(Ile)-lysidine synthase TilS/MesJ
LHKIRYVIDRTNFQPDLTLRNAIRHILANNEKKRDSAPVPTQSLVYDRIESSSDVDVFFYEGATTHTSSSYGGQDHENEVSL